MLPGQIIHSSKKNNRREINEGVYLLLQFSILTLSKMSFSAILRNDYLDHFETIGEDFDFDTFKNDTFENV